MSAASPKHAADNSNTVLLVTPPRCTRETKDGENLVEGHECESVPIPGGALSDTTLMDAVTSTLHQQLNRLWTVAESNFSSGGGGGRDNHKSHYKSEDEEKSDETKARELEERPISIVPAKSHSEVAGGYDVCREYGYKYEYTRDGSNNTANRHTDDDDDDDDEEQDEQHPTDFFSMLRHHQQQIFAKTAVDENNLPYIHILGKSYHPLHDYSARRDDESSLFWFTYRCDFPPIQPYKITTDAGWGCMLRSAQMLLGQTLRLHFKSRQWRPSSSLIGLRQDPFVRSILTWFADFPSKTESVYSLHNMVAAGLAKYEVLPGEWYGPGTACYVLRDLVGLHEKQGQPSLFRVFVASEGTVYRNAVHTLMTRDSKKRALQRNSTKQQQQPQPNGNGYADTPSPESPKHPLAPVIVDASPNDDNDDDTLLQTLEWDTGLLLLIPLRLGLNNFNLDYVQSLASSFALPQSVGVLGGRPRGARWFYGSYGDGSKVLGLDPHTVQTAPTRRRARVVSSTSSSSNSTTTPPTFVVDLSEEYLRSIHTTYQEIVPIGRMDPSIAMGFYCRTKKDFADLETALEQIQQQQHDQDKNPPDLFTWADRAPDYMNASSSSNTAMNDMLLDSVLDEHDGLSTSSVPQQQQLGYPDDDGSDEDDFVML
jgi:cysteine protease ATG4